MPACLIGWLKPNALKGPPREAREVANACSLVALWFLLLVAGNLPMPFSIMYPFTNGLLCQTAHAESRVRDLLDRVLGRTMPEGIVKTNGRLEATEVDVAANNLLS